MRNAKLGNHLKLRGSNKYHSRSFICLQLQKERENQKRRHGFWATLYRNILPKFELKWLKIRCTRTLNVCQVLENIVSRKRAKQLQRRSSGWMRLNQQGVKIITCGLQTNGSTYFVTIALKCWPDKMSNNTEHSGREFDGTFQFYQASLLVVRAEGKLFNIVELEVFHTSFWSFHFSDW